MLMLTGLLTLMMTHAAAAPNRHPPLPIVYSVGPEISPEMGEYLRGIVDGGLKMVMLFPPLDLGRTAFAWPPDQVPPQGRQIHLVITTSTDPLITSKLANKVTWGTDAFTVLMGATDESEEPLLVVALLADSLFYDAAGGERVDSVGRLVTALAHEFYGNVQHFLELDLASLTAQTPADRKEQEVRAFYASLRYLHDLPKDSRFARLPASLRSKMRMQIPREIAGYRSWAAELPGHPRAAECEALIAGLNKPWPE